MEVAPDDKPKARATPPPQSVHLPPPRGPYDPGWRTQYNTYDAPNPDPHGAPPPPQSARGPPVYTGPPRGPPDMYGRHGSMPGPSPTSESHSAFRPINGSHEQHPPTHGLPPGPGQGPANYRPHVGYPPNEPRPNGEAHSLPMISHGDPVQQIPASHPHTPYTPGPVPQTPGVYDGGGYFVGQAGASMANRQRRTTRAQQACDQCRSRKAKCDEGRPSCSHCKDNNVQCVYKDVPPAKHERSTQIIVDRLDKLDGGRDEVMAKLNELSTIVANFKSQLDALTGGVPSPKQVQKTPTVPKVEVNPTLASTSKPSPEGYDISGLQRGPDLRINDDPQGSPNLDTRELSIPIEHMTAAHKLLLWPSIQKLVPEKIDDDYVMRLEETRGSLRPYGQGEGDDLRRSTSPTTSTSPAVPSPPELAWGTGYGIPPGTDLTTFSSRPQAGGLTSSGILNVDEETVTSHLQSYLDNIHNLHPFLDGLELHTLVSGFIRNYSPAKVMSPPLPAGDPLAGLPRGKRKRSADYSSGMTETASYEAASFAIPKSMDNAIVLLVLALGAICSVKTDLPGPVPNPNTARPSSPYPNILEASPSLSESGNTSTFRSPSEELYSPASGHNRRPSYDMWTKSDSSPTWRNMDVIPGLAYFALASDILGNLLGGNDLKHAQACLLAALYTGQLARPFSSHAWICEASRTCQVLLRPRNFDLLKNGSPRKELIKFAFWTCLLLESDILAELDLPASGISRFEDRLYTTHGLFATPDVDTMYRRNDTDMIYYMIQIHLRKALNRVHTELYKAETHDSGSKKSTWSTGMQETLSYNLEIWRKYLPEELRWEDGDPPSDKINIARMRAKYYGARYIIHRPLLHHALHPMSSNLTSATAPSPSPSNVSSSQSHSSPPEKPALVAPTQERHSSDMGPPGRTVMVPDKQPSMIKLLDSKVHKACQACIEAAIQSTIAFDGIKGRLIVTNIFGTAHAQFGNMLVLSATYMSPLSQLVDRDTLKHLLDRTIKFLLQNRHISPSLKKDADILILIRSKIFEPPTTSFSSTDGS
ncbi:hypothetical protein FQN52_000749 [Onygenales sp. PD_12]|nr:hypothetical protein FQN52_000749 [Onygenales sp. PD_12]